MTVQPHAEARVRHREGHALLRRRETDPFRADLEQEFDRRFDRVWRNVRRVVKLELMDHRATLGQAGIGQFLHVIRVHLQRGRVIEGQLNALPRAVDARVGGDQRGFGTVAQLEGQTPAGSAAVLADALEFAGPNAPNPVEELFTQATLERGSLVRTASDRSR